MEAIILAGGFGTRLRNAVPDLPKPLAPINGVPFLEILLDYLVTLNFKVVTICTGYMSNVIIERLGYEYKDLIIRYSVETKPLGTGGALKVALQQVNSEFAYVANGDTYLEITDNQIFSKMLHCQTILGVYVEDTSRYGRLEVDNNKVVSLTEKGKNGPGIINAGSYILKKDFLENCMESSFSLEEKIVDALKTAQFECHIMNGIFIDIGIPEDFIRSQDILFGNSMRVKREI